MRCYDGAWDSEATALFARQDELLRRVKVKEPDAHCTYFPSEGQFQVHAWGRPLSKMHGSKIAALEEALGEH
jgi:hypothetical protein